MYMKSKINYIIPQTVLSGEEGETWKNIRSIIFNIALKRLTFPIESATLLGLSY